MPKYSIKAKDSHSNYITDILEANTQRNVIDILHRRGLAVLEIKELKVKVKPSKEKVKSSDLCIFSRQLATMVSAGLPLVDAMRALEDQTERHHFNYVIADVVRQIEGGSSFTDSISSHPQVFGSFFINMARAGEASGDLAEVLLRIADYLESVDSIKRKVRGAMIYPVIISIVTIIITSILLLKVIPVFKGIFASFGANLPVPTRIVVAFSDWFRHWFWIILIAAAIAAIVLQKYKKTASGRMLYDRIKLKVPVLGDLFHKVAISRFTKSLGILLKSGVSILESFEIVKKISGNVLIEKAIEKASESIKEGKSIEEPLRKSAIFPSMVVKMIAVGEKSGSLELMLDKISSYYDEQVTAMINAMASLIEPLLIVFLGVVVGGIVFSMYLPIFRLSAIIGG